MGDESYWAFTKVGQLFSVVCCWRLRLSFGLALQRLPSWCWFDADVPARVLPPCGFPLPQLPDSMEASHPGVAFKDASGGLDYWAW